MVCVARSYNLTDEMCWGSLWLYKATKDAKYLTEARKWFDPAPAWGMSWDEKIAGNQVQLFLNVILYHGTVVLRAR